MHRPVAFVPIPLFCLAVGAGRYLCDAGHIAARRAPLQRGHGACPRAGRRSNGAAADPVPASTFRIGGFSFFASRLLVGPSGSPGRSRPWSSPTGCPSPAHAARQLTRLHADRAASPLDKAARRGETEQAGWVAEWFKAAVLKTAVRATVPWVRIPPHPPYSATESVQGPRLGPFFLFVSKGVGKVIRPSETQRLTRNGSPIGPCLSSSAPRWSRDGVKHSRISNGLPRSWGRPVRDII